METVSKMTNEELIKILEHKYPMFLDNLKLAVEKNKWKKAGDL